MTEYKDTLHFALKKLRTAKLRFCREFVKETIGYVGFGRGATSWEWQVGRVGGHIRFPTYWVLSGVFSFYWCNKDGDIVRSWYPWRPFMKSRKTWTYARCYGASKRVAWKAVIKSWRKK